MRLNDEIVIIQEMNILMEIPDSGARIFVPHFRKAFVVNVNY